MTMPGRKYSQTSSSYRYGFNGKENDKDAGEGVQDYGMRIYDNRLGKFLSVDPLSTSYPFYTPYQFAGNKPIKYIDLDGAEEYDNYGDYKKDKGDGAMSEDKWDGSDGAWLESDRTGKGNRWKTAMSSITKNGWSDRLVDKSRKLDPSTRPNSQQQVGSSFGVTRDYYLWAQGEMDAKGYKSRWAKGAAYLVDELADTYEEGIVTGRFALSVGKLSVGLNVAIKDYAVTKFQDALFGAGMGSSYLEGYNWDYSFVHTEQAAVAMSVYENSGAGALNSLNDIVRKQGGMGSLAKAFSTHYIPSFALFDNISANGKSEGKATINTLSNAYGTFYRVHIPMFMLYPTLHSSQTGIKLNIEQKNAAQKANNGINDYYDANKVK
jgi:RHS repeat-associated protein